MKLLNKKNIALVKNITGWYKIYNKNGKLEYVGISEQLRHRLQSYYQKDDFSVNRTKKALRPHAQYYTVKYTTLAQAKKIEKSIKGKTPHNKV